MKKIMENLNQLFGLLKEKNNHLESPADLLERSASLRFVFPSDEIQYKALCGHALGEISIISRNFKELPPKKVYMKLKDGQVINLQPIDLGSALSGRSLEVFIEKTRVAETNEGFFITHFFCLAPTFLFAISDVKLMIDFAKKRDGFVVSRNIQKNDDRLKDLVNRCFSEDDFNGSPQLDIDLLQEFFDRLQNV